MIDHASTTDLKQYILVQWQRVHVEMVRYGVGGWMFISKSTLNGNVEGAYIKMGEGIYIYRSGTIRN